MSKVKDQKAKVHVKIQKYAALILLICTLSLIPCTFAFSLSMNIDPPSIKLIIKAGDTKTGDIMIQNLGSTTIDLKAYTEDWVYAKDGTKSFMKKGSSVYSCSSWIKLDAEKFTLKPKEAKKVTYVITTPKNTSGGHVSVIFFENQIDVKSGIGVSGRIGSIVYVDTEGDTKRDMETKDLVITASKEGFPVTINASMLNKGNTYLTINPKIKVMKDDKIVAEPAMRALNALPGEMAYSSCRVLGLTAGKYKAQMELSINDGTSRSQAEFTVTN
jgi:hypothetical protein